MLLNLERGVCLKTKRVQQLEYASLDDDTHAEIVLDQYNVGVEETRSAKLGSFVENLLYLVIGFGQSVEIAMCEHEVEVLFYVGNFTWGLEDAYDLFAELLIEHKTKGFLLLQVIKCQPSFFTPKKHHRGDSVRNKSNFVELLRCVHTVVLCVAFIFLFATFLSWFYVCDVGLAQNGATQLHNNTSIFKAKCDVLFILVLKDFAACHDL